MQDIIEGRNPVIEILKSGRDINKLLVANGAKEGAIKKIIGMAKDKGIVIQYVDRKKLDHVSEIGNHQGVIAYVAAHEYADMDTVLDEIEARGEKPFVLVLDEISDPHNLGSILRTADSSGVNLVIIPKRRAVGLTAAVAKTSAGAIEYVPVAKVTNIANTIEKLKERNIWVYGADMNGDSYFNTDLTGSIAIVMGSEGKGISRLVREKCDFIVSIPMGGNVTSLNASVAASILMYEVVRQKHGKK
ncbi:MAG: 23S rRNA (guanosine(2251)-2'-O)-methyltransferase RlmB [Firmicutes bacterium]|nr:23S rRNA (guanosine(2251)-2'-O)-methyltransferase RlmB [Bacillota bacterium]